MDRQYSYDLDETSASEEHSTPSISVPQLQRLVDLIDGSDVSEIEVKRVEDGMRLVLRKAIATVGGETLVASAAAAKPMAPALVDAKQLVTAPLVGVFHTWAKPKGKDLVAVGDQVKVGQLLGTIQSLNVLSEVESPVAGRIAEIFAQDGQPVEYGQQLMTIDSAEGA